MEPILHIAKNESDYALRIIPIEFVFLPVLYAKHVKVVRARGRTDDGSGHACAGAESSEPRYTYNTRPLSARDPRLKAHPSGRPSTRSRSPVRGSRSPGRTGSRACAPRRAPATHPTRPGWRARA